MKYFQRLRSLVSGKKAYFFAVVYGAYELLVVFNVVVVTVEQDVLVKAFLGVLFGVAVRAAIAKGK